MTAKSSNLPAFILQNTRIGIPKLDILNEIEGRINNVQQHCRDALCSPKLEQTPFVQLGARNLSLPAVFEQASF